MTTPADKETVERLAGDCELAAKAMAGRDTFPTGQGIFRDAADTLRALQRRVDELEAQPHYSYIGKDGKAILARDLEDRIEFLEGKLIQERKDVLMNAYHEGIVNDGVWDHVCSSEARWLVGECGLDPQKRQYRDAEIRAKIPDAAKKVLQEND